MESLTSKIKKTIYKIAPSGRLIAILVLHRKDFLFDEDKVLKNAILIDNAVTVINSKLYNGSKVEIDAEDLGKPIKRIINVGREEPLPDNCPSCNEVLSEKKDENDILLSLDCTNIFCSGQSQSHLFRIFAYLMPDNDIHVFRKFLNEFVTGSSTTDILNITDFEKIYMQIKGRNTKTRMNQWVKVHGGFLGEKMFDIDVAIEEHLASGEIHRSKFWLAANLPAPKELQLPISNINPVDFISGRDEVFKGFNHSQQSYLLDNMDFILKLLNIFNFYGKTKWI